MVRKALLGLFLVSFLAAMLPLMGAQGKGRSTTAPGGQGKGRDATSERRMEKQRTETRRQDGEGPTYRKQKELNQAQRNSGVFRRLQERTGMSDTELTDMYHRSGARNFGDFVSAVMVADNLGLDRESVLQGLHNQNLRQTVANMGIDKKRAEEAIRQAKLESRGINRTKQTQQSR
jgi:hypothetical protein